MGRLVSLFPFILILLSTGCYQAEVPEIADVKPCTMILSESKQDMVEITIHGSGFSDYVEEDESSKGSESSDRYFYVRLINKKRDITRYLTSEDGSAGISWTPDQFDELHAWLDPVWPDPLLPGEYDIEVVLPGRRLLKSPVSFLVVESRDAVDSTAPDDGEDDSYDGDDDGYQPDDTIVCLELDKESLMGVSEDVTDSEKGVFLPACSGHLSQCDYAVYRFDIDVPGKYYLWGAFSLVSSLVINPSFYMMMDMSRPFIWDVLQCKSGMLPYNTWIWNHISMRDLEQPVCDEDEMIWRPGFMLNRGTHYITVFGRSGGLTLAKVVLMNRPDSFPQNPTFDICQVE